MANGKRSKDTRTSRHREAGRRDSGAGWTAAKRDCLDLGVYRRPLTDHLDDFAKAHKSKTTSAKNVKQVKARLSRVFADCGFQVVADIKLGRIEQFLAGLQTKGRRPERATTTWPPSSSFATGWWPWSGFKRTHWPGWRPRGTKRRTGGRPSSRRALEDDEKVRILNSAKASDQSGTTGSHRSDRYMVYLVPFGTGFRASEVASLMPDSFNLDGDPPTITCNASYSKRARPWGLLVSGRECEIRGIALVNGLQRGWRSGSRPPSSSGSASSTSSTPRESP